jgi:hypothetical protein
VLRQILTALVRCGGDAEKLLVVDMLRDGLQGDGGLSPIESVWAADDLALPDGRRLLLADLIQRLDVEPPFLVCHSVQRLGGKWLPEHVTTLTQQIV